jgi:hypothetical protein
MSARTRTEQILLWLFVILSGVVVGAGLYEMRVTVPLWANSPPESAWYWEAVRNANPQYVPNSGARFWIFVTPTHLLLSVATLIAGLTTRREHRRWLFASTAIFIILHISALVWFVPTIDAIRASQSLGLSRGWVITRTHLWVSLSWVRASIVIAGFVAGLRALTIPVLEDK